MATIDDELERMGAQLVKWRERLDALVAILEEVGSDVEAVICQRIDELRAKHEEAQSMLADLKTSDGERTPSDVGGEWSTVESGFFKAH